MVSRTVFSRFFVMLAAISGRAYAQLVARYVTYAFIGPDGRRVTNTIRRTLMSPPRLQRGGPIDLLYEPSNSDHSTMSMEFASSLAQKPFAAWLFLLAGVYPALYVYRYMRWRRGA